MPGGWAMSMAWMRMPGQTWLDAAVSFLGMWIVMMVAMMLPSLVPMLWRYREANGHVGTRRLGLLTTLVGIGYFSVWTAFGVAIFPFGVALAAVEMQQPALARAVPAVVGVVVLIAGALQFTSWKVRHLACCQVAPEVRTVPADARTAVREGVRLGLVCSPCCANLMAILVVMGVMDLLVMAAVTAAITFERLTPIREPSPFTFWCQTPNRERTPFTFRCQTPNRERVARAIGLVIIGTAVVLIAQAAGLA